MGRSERGSDVGIEGEEEEDGCGHVERVWGARAVWHTGPGGEAAPSPGGGLLRLEWRRSGARAASTGGLPKQAKFVLPSLSRFANCPPANPLDQQGVPILAVDGDADDGVYMCRWPPSDSGARNRDFNREYRGGGT